MSLDSKMLLLRAQLYTAMQTLKDDKLHEFWDLIEEIRTVGAVHGKPAVTVHHESFTSEDNKTIYYWPYCSTCQQPYSFDDEEPFAYCACGTSEWAYPRPAEWIPDPSLKKETTTNGYHLLTIHAVDRADPIGIILTRMDGTRYQVMFDQATEDAEYAAAYRKLLARGQVPEGMPGMPRDSMG